jgi:hypothetical protein
MDIHMKKPNKALFRSVLGRAPWRVWKGHGSFLFFDFGRKLRISPMAVSGYSVITVTMAHWFIRHQATTLANSESADAVIDKSIQHFVGKQLCEIITCRHITASCEYYAARLSFADNWSLDIRMYEKGVYEAMFDIKTPNSITMYDYAGNLISRPVKPNTLRPMGSGMRGQSGSA